MSELHRISQIIAHSATTSYRALDVARAYGLPGGYDGTGQTIGIVELGGGYNAADMKAAGLNADNVTVVPIDGAKSKSDGPNGADGEVMLDVEIAAAVAPGAKLRLYFCANTDQGFLDGIREAVNECDIVSISWGGPESSWDAKTIEAYEQILSAARAKGVAVFVASGDAGSKDGTRTNIVDFPASSPSVIGCGGTRLTLSGGKRTAEVVWNDDPTQSATGGGVSSHFPGRQVPDIAGNADPRTGYQVVVDGGSYVVGGTSAVAPLQAACLAVVRQAAGITANPSSGTPTGSFDLLNLLLTNPTLTYDVTVGNNGGFKAGPGRDMTTGYGAPDWGKVLALVTSGTQVPAPGGNPAPAPAPTVPTDASWQSFETDVLGLLAAFEKQPSGHANRDKFFAAINHWIAQQSA
jgi:kumamolisin